MGVLKMKNLELTNHANERLSQRGMTLADAVMIVDFGTEVDGGYIFLQKEHRRPRESEHETVWRLFDARDCSADASKHLDAPATQLGRG